VLFDHPAFEAAALRAIERIRPDVIVVVLSRLGSLLEQIRRRFPAIPVVLDLIDALGANMRRRAERERWLAPLWRREAERLDAWDARLIERSAAATVVAERDRRALLNGAAALAPRAGAPAPESLERRLRVLPVGLELEDEMPRVSPRRETVVLTGNLGYFPTVEGARYFAGEVWPRLREMRPEVAWLLAGARPAKAIRDLGGLDGVDVLPNPADLGAVLAEASVSIAPLRAGSGTPIKILEAMAAGVPVVTTAAGRAGLDGLPEGAVEVADTAEDYAEKVALLLGEPERRRRQRALAWRWLRSRHHAPRVVERFEEQLRGLIAR